MLANEKIENILELKFKKKKRNTKEGKVIVDTLIKPWRGGGHTTIPGIRVPTRDRARSAKT